MRRSPDRADVLLAAVSLVAGALVVYLAVDLFPYHSSNHDEGVYLQHARLLLGGKLWFSTSLPDVFHWWFFVEDGSRLYSKYQPVVPALFAVGLAVGTPRLVLGVVGTGIVGLVGLLTRTAYDGPTGVVAAVLVVASPLFLLTTSVFLPYAPATLLNLVFAYAYVRLMRGGGRWWSVLAGTAVGLAFFARPYTAVLFALPFIGHALVLLARARNDRRALRRRLAHLLPVAGLGVAFVGLALAYNAVVTGAPLRFPYAAFAPEDGVGFGHREILGYERDYDLALALEANGTVLWEFVTRFVAAPPLGAVLPAVGVGLLAARVRDAVGADDHTLPDESPPWLTDMGLRILLGGVLVSVVAGNLAFWGNLNVLADVGDPTDGLIAQFGPFYHYDLLLPLSAFGAAGGAWLVGRLHAVARRRVDRRRALAIVLGVLLVAAPLVAVAEANALGPPIAENRAYTERYASAYEPFEERSFDDAVVFVPNPYGPWLGHPFQSLRNDAGLDGDVVYAQDRAPDDEFRVVDHYPDRNLYRFTYRGDWGQVPPEPVEAHIQPLAVRNGTAHTVTFETGVVGQPSTVRLEDGDDAVVYDVTRDATGTMPVEYVVHPGYARVTGDGLEQRGIGTVDFDGGAELQLSVTYVQAGGATVTYRQELGVEERGDSVRLLWPAEAEVCRLTPDCGHDGMYVPGGDYISGVSVNQSVSTS
ncbi:ArnT family glycosyltransferase [Halorarius halobius]|uniref:ArnT family glycosyltransferase n=1 Tax=Halorarius halobius TaxID=2962671 RepID=UPI0020CF8448|nr:glycosyltransferase family 39 protein [Halorarius halobius]